MSALQRSVINCYHLLTVAMLHITFSTQAGPCGKALVLFLICHAQHRHARMEENTMCSMRLLRD